MILTLGVGTAAIADPAADCNGQINIRYISGPAFGVDGDIYRVEIGLGTGTITDGVANTMSLDTVRFFLDCTFSGLPGCTDDGGVVVFAGNISTTCATTWTPVPGANLVDFTANPDVVIPALTPAFPGFCQLQFDIQLASSAAAHDDLPQTPNRVEEIVQYSVATCDNGLPSTGSQSAAFDICPDCGDGNLCTADICDQVTGTCSNPPNVTCDDLNGCTLDVCNPATGTCVYTPNVFCNDNDNCTSDVCNPATGTCVYTPNVVCNDGDFCTSDLCNPATGTCVYTPNVVCNDGDFCTSDLCNPATGTCVYTPNVVCNDSNVCTSDLCNPATGTCVYTPSVTCDDGDVCTDDVCNPVLGCVYTPNDLCEEICRTPGFWGTHADEDPSKPCSNDITGAVITLGGGSLNICGECITNESPGVTLPPGNAASVLEALCVSVKGQQTRQLARQLTAAALNCIVSGFPANCAGSSISTLFANCNLGCAVESGNAPGPAPVGFNVGACISAIDCFNNGFEAGTNGECGDSTGCHDRALPLDVIFPGGTNCNRQGPAGSSGECKSARSDNNCTIIQPGEANCSADACP